MKSPGGFISYPNEVPVTTLLTLYWLISGRHLEERAGKKNN